MKKYKLMKSKSTKKIFLIMILFLIINGVNISTNKTIANADDDQIMFWLNDGKNGNNADYVNQSITVPIGTLVGLGCHNTSTTDRKISVWSPDGNTRLIQFDGVAANAISWIDNNYWGPLNWRVGEYKFNTAGVYIVKITNVAVGKEYSRQTVTVQPKDSSAPSCSNGSPTGTTYTNNSNYSVTTKVTATDSGSGMKNVKFDAWFGAWVSQFSSKSITTSTNNVYSTTYSLSEIKNSSNGAINNGDGTYTFCGWAYDNNGNDIKFDLGTVILDTVAPTAGTVTLKKNSSAGTAYTSGTWTTTDVYVKLNNGSDALSGHASTNYKVTGASTISTTTGDNTLSTEGTSSITVTTKDNAGNVATNSYTVNIDKTSPTINSLIQNNSSWTNTEVILTGKAKDATAGINAYAFTTSSTVPSTWTSIAATISEVTHTYSVTQNGTYYYWVKDQAGNTKPKSIEITNIDTTKPTVSSFTMIEWTNQDSIKVDLTATDTESKIQKVVFKAWTGTGDKRTEKVITNSSTNDTFTTSTTFKFVDIVNGTTGVPTNVNGEYYIEASVYDNAGNRTDVAYKTVYYDTLAPINGSVTINNDAKYTNTQNVTLNLHAEDSGSGVGYVSISNTTTVGTVYDAYSTTKSWTLTTGDGVKTVYVVYKDRAGNATATTF